MATPELDPTVQSQIENTLRQGDEYFEYRENLNQWAEKERLGRRLVIRSGKEFMLVGVSLPLADENDNQSHIILLVNSHILITTANPKSPEDVTFYREKLDPAPGIVFSFPGSRYPDVISVEKYLKLRQKEYKGRVVSAGIASRYPLHIRRAVEAARELKKKSEQVSQSKALIKIPQPPPIEKPVVKGIDQIFNADEFKKLWPRN